MERRSLFMFICTSQWKEEIRLYLFAFYDRKREYILFINASLSSWEYFFFFIFWWITPLSHKKIFSFHSQINDRVAFQLLSYLELAYLCFYWYRFYQNKLYFKRHRYTMIYQCLFCYIGLYRLTTEPWTSHQEHPCW